MIPVSVRLALVIIAAAARGATAQDLAVTTFNIRYGTANDGPDAWPLRKDAMIARLRETAPDVIGLQEALRGQLDDLHAGLTGYGEAGVGRDDGRTAGEYAAILFKVERLELLESNTFWFSDTPTVPGSRSWGNNVTRICTYARFRDKQSGRVFYVFNVHLDHESQNSRERSAGALLRAIERRRDRLAPVIVTGDFNAGEDNPAVQAVAARLRDTFRALHPADSSVGTFNGFHGDSTTGQKIDYIFTDAGFDAVSSGIDRTKRPDGRNLSDHFPVFAVLRRH